MAAQCSRRIVPQLLLLAKRSISGSEASAAAAAADSSAKIGQESKTESTTTTKRLPLEGLKVVELSGLPAIPTGIAVVPFCGLILADFGADVTVIKKAEGELLEYRFTRGKTLNVLNLQNRKDLEGVRNLCLQSDVLLDPYRPGVIERAGLDPVQLLKENEKLIIARITGFGQTGEMSQRFGRELNYVAMSGLLPTFAGHSSSRFPYWTPANMLAGFAGGSLMAAFGILIALNQRILNGGKGAIVDVSMVDSLAYLGTFQTIYKDVDNVWNKPYSWFSGDCPIYRCYETSDGKFMAVAALERRFHRTLFKTLGLNLQESDIWMKPEMVTEELEKIFKTKTRHEWEEVFRGVDACVTAAVDLSEVGRVRHHQQRKTFTLENQKFIPKPTPRIYTREEYESMMYDLDSKIFSL